MSILDLKHLTGKRVQKDVSFENDATGLVGAVQGVHFLQGDRIRLDGLPAGRFHAAERFPNSRQLIPGRFFAESD